MTDGDPLAGLQLLLFCFAIYFAPSIIAKCRNHPQFWPILIVNGLLGWTFVMWVVALAWATTTNNKVRGI